MIKFLKDFQRRLPKAFRLRNIQYQKYNQYFLVLESDDVDIQYVEYLKGNLYVSGEKRAYGKPYVIIFELEELIKLNDIFYNGDSISLDKNVEN